VNQPDGEISDNESSRSANGLGGRGTTLLALLVFAQIYTGLAVWSYQQKSATWDEPLHLVSGYLALSGDFRTDPEHPPLLRAWAALPIAVGSDANIDLSAIGKPSPRKWLNAPQFRFGYRFIYKDNDADRILSRARLMIVLLALALGVVVFIWSRSLYGLLAGTASLALFALEPNLLAHARLVTSDLGFALLACITVYFLWRACGELTPARIAGFGICFALSFIAKFTAILLLPLAALLLSIRALRSKLWSARLPGDPNLDTRLRRLAAAAAILAGALLLSWLTIWAAYGFRYTPGPDPSSILSAHEDGTRHELLPITTRAVTWADEHRLLPNAYSQGFLLGQIKAQSRSAYLLGELRNTGWWYYFPVAFLVKTPSTLLFLLLAAAIMVFARRDRFLDDEIFLFLPMVLFMAAAMRANLNIGLRHILMIFPFAIIAAGKPVQILWAEGRKAGRILLLLLAGVLLYEHVTVAPHYLAFFNLPSGGPAKGHRVLVDSNLDWGQDLPALARWMEQEGVATVNLSYFGIADIGHHGINAVHLPGAPLYALRRISLPELPGWVAVSVTNEAGVALTQPTRTFLAPLRDREPDHVIGHTINLYWMERPWW
jgi:hypothetical protein